MPKVKVNEVLSFCVPKGQFLVSLWSSGLAAEVNSRVAFQLRESLGSPRVVTYHASRSCQSFGPRCSAR
jgi:hypothetical protein